MSKRKKHKKSKSSRKNNVVKNTSTQPAQVKTTEVVSTSQANDQVQSDVRVDELAVAKPQDKANKVVMSDVAYSLILLAIIIAVFVVLMLLMSNRAISDSFYGIIKIKI